MPARALKSEDDFLRLLDRTFGRARAGRGVALGRGDDGALLARQGWCVTVDALVEDVHFRRDTIAPGDLGRKAFLSNASDLNAMGTRASVGFLSLTLPGWVDRKYLQALLTGMAAEFRSHRVELAGGNVSAGGELQLHLTLMGPSPAAPLRRDRAKVGDALVVIGEIGLARAGLLLQEQKRKDPRLDLRDCSAALSAHSLPEPPLQVGPRLATLAARKSLRLAALDLSDGLARDALRFTDRGRPLGAEIDLEKLPVTTGLRRAAGKLGRDPRLIALQGGEDYALLLACPPETLHELRRVAGAHPVKSVGFLSRRHGMKLNHAGSIAPVAGHDHFSSAAG